MSVCRECGAEIAFRVIEGRTVPLGCLCNPDRNFYFGRGENTHHAWCPVCNAEVFFVEHNGGCVWLDELGPPWPKHGCFDDDGNPVKKVVTFAGGEVDEVGRIHKADLRTDLGQRFIVVSFPGKVRELYPHPDFWERGMRLTPGDSIGRLSGALGLTMAIVSEDGARFRCWEVELSVCGNCEKPYVAWEGHRLICKAHR